MTALERAQCILGGQLEVLDTMTGRTIKASEIEREILAAERAAVEAFAKQATSDFALLTRLDVGAIVVGEAVALINGRLEAWLRSRGEG